MRGVTVRRIGDGGVEGEPVSAGIADLRLAPQPGDRQRRVERREGLPVGRGRRPGLARLRGAAQPARAEQPGTGWCCSARPAAGSRTTRSTATGTTAPRSTGRRTPPWSWRTARAATSSSASWSAPPSRVRVVRNTAAKNDDRLPVLRPPRQPDQREPRPGEREDGLVLSGGQFGSDGNRLARNVANGNHGAGIAIVEDNKGHAAGNSLKGNTAKRNGGPGIDAVPGTIDKGGNRASGNATPQCVNVVCSR